MAILRNPKRRNCHTFIVIELSSVDDNPTYAGMEVLTKCIVRTAKDDKGNLLVCPLNSETKLSYGVRYILRDELKGTWWKQ